MRFRNACAAAMVCASLVFTAGIAGARDRPGTPNGDYLDVCHNDMTHAPRICGHFTNTAHEDVRFEFETTRNGAPFPLDAGTFFCAPDAKQLTRIRCVNFGGSFVYSDHYTTSGPGARHYDADITYGFETADVDFGATYCMHFRARRASDDVVSENWSAWACATTPPRPAKPGRPSFSVTYHGSQTPVRNASSSGSATQAVPESMEIALGGGVDADEYDLTVTSVSGGSPYSDSRHGGNQPPFEYKIDPAVEAVNVRVCGVNVSGTTCSTQLQSIAGQGQIALPGPKLRPGGLNAPQPGGIAAPIALRNLRSPGSLDEAMMVGVDIPGSDYQHGPIAGTADDCLKRCNADGSCLSWTWVKPGVQGPQAQCWLKNAVPPSVKNADTTSGIKRGSTIVR